MISLSELTGNMGPNHVPTRGSLVCGFCNSVSVLGPSTSTKFSVLVLEAFKINVLVFVLGANVLEKNQVLLSTFQVLYINKY